MFDRDEAVKKAKAQIDQWDAEMKKLEAQMREAHADSEAEIKRQMETIQKHRDEAETKMKEMQSASGDAWKEMQAGFQKAWTDMTTQFEQARKRMGI